jgi:hypothetical protein
MLFAKRRKEKERTSISLFAQFINAAAERFVLRLMDFRSNLVRLQAQRKVGAL